MSEAATIAPWMSEDELEEVTGVSDTAAQAVVLDQIRVPYIVQSDGALHVARGAFFKTKRPERKPVEWGRTPLGKWQAEQRQMAEGRKTYLPTPEQQAQIDARNREAIARQKAATVRFHAAKRRTVKLQRVAPWADLEAVKAVYREAQRLTRETGTPHHVDHIIPLQGKWVSGLHVENNLQILTGSENSRKRNRFEVEA